MSKGDQDSTQVTTEQLVADTVATLRNDDQMDFELSDILSENIVKMAPIETAVDDAVKAIEALAVKRAEETQ